MSEGKIGQIVPAPVLPLVTPEEAAQQWARFEALKSKLLVDDDYQVIADKRFIKRSGFRKIGVYFGISDRIVKEERADRDDGSFSWRIVVEAEAPNGRTCVGVGACDSRERNFAHLEHDVYATAHTRAKSRAISDMIAGGAVSAEEASPTDVVEEPVAASVPPERQAAEAGVDERLAYLKDVLRQVMREGAVYTPAALTDMARAEASWALENDVGDAVLQLMKIGEVEQVYFGAELQGYRRIKGMAPASPPPSAPAGEAEAHWTLSEAQDLFPKDLEELLGFEETPEWILIRPRQYLGTENFRKIAAIIREHAGDYISAGKDSHFRLPR